LPFLITPEAEEVTHQPPERTFSFLNIETEFPPKPPQTPPPLPPGPLYPISHGEAEYALRPFEPPAIPLPPEPIAPVEVVDPP
jgi:hypothetical protein